jgi:hypothetical protein
LIKDIEMWPRARSAAMREWRERAFGSAILDARPDIPFPNEAEDEGCHRVTDEKVDLIV